MASTAWKCSTMSVCSVRITHRSSAIVPRCGNSSLIIRPDWPQGRNRNGEPMQRAVAAFRRPAGRRTEPACRDAGSSRLVVEGIDVRKAAGQEDHDQVLGFRRMVGRQRREQSRRHSARPLAERPGRGRSRPARAATADFKNGRRPIAGRSSFRVLFMLGSVDVEELVGGQQDLGQAGPGFPLASSGCAAPSQGLSAVAQETRCARSRSSGSAGGPRPAHKRASIRRAGRPRRRAGGERGRRPVPARTGCS